MLPHSSFNVLDFGASKPKQATPRRTLSGFEGDILSFASPSAPELVGIAPARDCDSSFSTGSSQNISSVSFQTPMTPSSILGSPFMAGQEGVTSSGRSGSRRSVDASTMSACLVLVSDPNKFFTCSPRSLSNPSMSRGDARPHAPKTRMPRSERIANALDILKGGRLSPFDLILEILDGHNVDYAGYRIELYKDKSSKLPCILDSILATDAGKQKLWAWMRPHALEMVCEAIDKEMDSVTTGNLLSGLSAITPDFIKSWTVADVCERAPFLTGVLLRAAQTSSAKEKNKKKAPRAVCVEYAMNHCILMSCTRCPMS